MVDAINDNNILIVNAPAGSGKTYRIKAEIQEYIISNPKHKILCITYTNRAADELLRGIDAPNVYISTIHSYINDMVSPLMKKKEIIDLYFEVYKEAIQKRIDDPEKQESNNKYKEKFGSITLGEIRRNIKGIYYNETQYNSLYYGGLSHNDLLSFTYKILEKYPKLYQKINRQFKMIIIDEYQDTSPEVFNIFFNAVNNTPVKLYLYGDKMQQIYKTYDSQLNSKLASIKQDDRKIINHRSIPVIVDILNNIYNKKDLDQEYFDELTNIQPDFKPRVILSKCTEFDKIIEDIISEDSNTLVLYVFNSERFNKIGVGNLYKAFSTIKKYGFGKKVTASEILLNGDEIDNPDDLMKLLIIMYKANEYWKNKEYGALFKKCRDNKKIFNIQYVTLKSLKDKEDLHELWKEIFDTVNREDTTIGQLIEMMKSKNLLESTFVEIIDEDSTYSEVFKVQMREIINLEENNKKSNVSTQHGVKGESHTSVVFVAEDSKRNDPRISMYEFFEVWSKVEFSLDEFEDFYFKYLNFTQKVDKAKIESNDTEYLIDRCNKIIEEFNSCEIFNVLLKEMYNIYVSRPIKTNKKQLFKEATVRYILTAYKLFYVGCSRARKNLTILIDEDKISEYAEEFKEKVKRIGFDVQD